MAVELNIAQWKVCWFYVALSIYAIQNGPKVGWLNRIPVAIPVPSPKLSLDINAACYALAIHSDLSFGHMLHNSTAPPVITKNDSPNFYKSTQFISKPTCPLRLSISFSIRILFDLTQ